MPRYNSISIQLVLTTVALWHAVACVCSVPSRASSLSTSSRGADVSTKASLSYAEQATEFKYDVANTTNYKLYTLQQFKIKGSIDITNLPQRTANPDTLIIQTDSTFQINFVVSGFERELVIQNLSDDPNIFADIAKGSIVLKGAPFADDRFFAADTIALPKGWQTGDPTSITTLKLAGPHGKRATTLDYTVQVFYRTFYDPFTAGGAQGSREGTQPIGTRDAALTLSDTPGPVSLATQLRVTFGDDAVGRVAAQFELVGGGTNQVNNPPKVNTKPHRIINEKAKGVGAS